MNVCPAFLIWFQAENLNTCAECDKGVNVSNTQGGGLAGDVQNRDQRGGENTRPKKNSQLVRTKDCG